MSALIFLLLFSPACRLPFVKTYFSPKDRVLLVLICCNYTWRWVVRQTAICRLNSDHRQHLLALAPPLPPLTPTLAVVQRRQTEFTHTHFEKVCRLSVTVHSLSSTPRIKCRFIIFQPTHPPVRVTGVCVQVFGHLLVKHQPNSDRAAVSWAWSIMGRISTQLMTRTLKLLFDQNVISKHWRGRFSPWRNVI